MVNQRSSGVLLHPTSLPSSGGIGDLGPAAYEFVDWVAAAKQALWQVLPVGPVGYGNSPYSCTSAFAGNVLMISLERLAERGYINPALIAGGEKLANAVDFESFPATNFPLLRGAAQIFLRSSPPAARARYDSFCVHNEWWLDDYALFAVLREKYAEMPWSSWSKGLVHRKPEALDQSRKEHKDLTHAD